MFRNKKTTLLLLAVVLALIVEVVNADFTLGEPENLGPTVNSTADEFSLSISADGLILVFSSNRPGGSGRTDLWMTTRQTASDPWPEPVNLGPTINSSEWDVGPCISANGLRLYFHSSGHGGEGSGDIFVSTRESRDDPWGEPVNLGSTVNSSGAEADPSISADGLELYFTLGDVGFTDIWVSTRETKDDPWGEPVDLGPPVNSAYEEAFPWLSVDGLTLFFSSGLFGGAAEVRPGLGVSDIWMTRRKTRDADWSEPVNIGTPVNSVGIEWSPAFTADGSTLYFVFDPWNLVPDRSNIGWSDIWQASIEPVVDLNSDGIVDAADMSILVDHWGDDDPFCDIGPMPWGDGIVDVQDLIILAEHLFEEIPPAEPVE